MKSINYDVFINTLKYNQGYSGYSVVYIPINNGIESHPLFLKVICKSKSECEERIKVMTKQWIDKNIPINNV